jgi:citrate lyase subunit beta/citryl-CoA lyase
MTARSDPRTYLFVPGNRPDRFGKALASGADAVVLDLEDAVAADAKDAARNSVRAWAAEALPGERARAVVRINDLGSPHAAADLAAAAEVGLTAVMLPKTESADDVASVR